jgi:DNA-binding NarL/FixJ family response regulator
MRVTRVVLIDMNKVLRQLVRGILETDSSVQVVAELPDTVPLEDAVAATDARVVIFGTEASELSAEATELLSRRPRVRLLTVTRNARRTSLYVLKPHREDLGEVSASALLDAVKGEPQGMSP